MMIKTNIRSNDKHPLSASWGTSQRMTSQRLSFFGKGITCIDKLDINENVLSSLKQLDLSHNALVKVQNMRQFPNLQIVNLAHNHIADGKQIVKLSKLSKIKTVLVKGNPFLKSGQGRIQAMKYLMGVNTDIDILSNKLQLMLSECVKNFSRNQVKNSYISHIQVQIQLITDFNIKVAQNSTGQVYDRIITTFIQQKAQQIQKTCRATVIKNIIKLADMELSGFETKQQLQTWFQKCLYEYIERLQAQTVQLNKKLDDKLQIFDHVKSMRKQKFNRDNFMTNFKKPLKPLLSKHPNSQNIPRPFELEPKKILNDLPSIYQRNQVSQQMPRKSLTNDVIVRGRNLQQKFQNYYSNMLTKYSSVYQLLYSPLHSLKNKQKDLLIETLSNHLRQKSFAVFKNQKVKEQIGELNRKLIEKQKALKYNEQKVVEYKMAFNQKIRTIQQMESQIEKLSQQLSQINNVKGQLMKRVQYLQQQIGQSKLKAIRYSGQIDKLNVNEQVFQRIQLIRQNRIKKQYLKVLIMKASALNNLRNTQKANKLNQNKQIVQQCFNFMKKQAINTKNRKNMQLFLRNSRQKEYMSIFLKNIKLQLQSSKLQNKKNVRNKRNYLKFFYEILKQKKFIKEKINKSLSKRYKSLLQFHWKQWKNYTQQARQVQRCNEANQYYQQNLKSNIFKNWLVFIKLPIHLQAQLSVDLKTKKIKNFYTQMAKNLANQRVQKQKFLNLIIYLNVSSRLNNFQKLKNNILNIKQIRSQKQIRLTNKLRKKYFHDFIRVTFMGKKAKIEQRLKQNQILLLRKKNIIEKLNSQQHNKQMRIKRFSGLIQKYRVYDMSRSLKDSLKQFMIEDKKIKTDIKSFFSQLQAQYYGKLRIKNKIVELKYTLNANNNRIYDDFKVKRHFINQLTKPLGLKKKLKLFLNKKYYKLMIKCFKQWKMQVLRGEIEYLKNKVQEFGPEIQQISKRQKITFQQKIVLMNIIQSKQKTIKGYIKQLEQAEYAIKTKQDKYQKLKQFIHQSGQEVTVIGSKVHAGLITDSRIPQRDFDTFLQEQKKQFFTTFRRF